MIVSDRFRRSISRSFAWRSVVIAAIVGSVIPAGRGDDSAASPRPPSPRMVQAECQMVILPQKAMLALVAEFSDAEKAETAWDEVQKMFETGAATRVADLFMRGTEGQNLNSETVEETRYANQFEPSPLPSKVPAEKPLEFLQAWPLAGVIPSSFQTRKVGEMLQLTIRVTDDGKWLDIDAAPEHVRFLHWQKIEAGRRAGGAQLTVEQPCFHSMKDTFDVRLKNGRKALVGVHKVPDLEKTFELFLLRASVREPGPK